MKRHIAAVVMVALAAGGALAQPPGGRGQEQREINVDKESLIFDIPEKWYPFYKSTDAKVDTFIFPTGQEPTDWKETLQLERFLTTLGVESARQVFDLKTQSSRTSCGSYDAQLIREYVENGYSTIIWRETCQASEDMMLMSLKKTIVGAEQLYIASKIWKYEPRDSEFERWVQYMDSTFVCDPNTGTNPCVPPNRRAEERPRR